LLGCQLLLPEAVTLAVNIGPISIHVVPEANTLAVNLGPISIHIVPETDTLAVKGVSFWDYRY
jgi:hypothetical protein